MQAPAYGTTNVWDLYDTTWARTVPCNKVGVFLHMVYSPSTHGIQSTGADANAAWVDFRLYGPVTDDANGEFEKITAREGVGAPGNRVVIEGRAMAGVGRGLSKAEFDGVMKYNGFEANACLKAEFRLNKWQVDIHMSEEEKDQFVDRIKSLGVSGTMLQTVCSTLGMRRVR